VGVNDDIDVKVGVSGADAAKQKLKGVGKAAEGMGDDVKKGGSKAAGATQSLSNAINSLKGFALGFISVAGLKRFFDAWYESVKKVTAAQKELVETTKGLDQAAKSLAGQASVMGTEAGMVASREQILGIQKAGNLPSWKMAEAVAVATHSMFAEDEGKLLTPGQAGIAGVVASYAQLKNLDEAGVSAMLKVLKHPKMGVTDAQTAARRVQQLGAVQRKSAIDSFAKFIPGASDTLMNLMGAGATPEAALAQYASALDVELTGPRAFEATKKMSDTLLQYKKMGEIIPGYAKLPYDVKMKRFGEWVSRATEPEMIKAGVEPGRVGALRKLYTRTQLPRVGFFAGLAKQATAAQLQAEVGGYADTTQGKLEALEAERLRIAAQASPPERVGAELIKLAEEEFKLKTARGEESWWSRDVVETERLVKKRFLGRVEDLYKRGLITEQEKEQNIENILTLSGEYGVWGQWESGKVSPWNRLHPVEAGQVEQTLNDYSIRNTYNINPVGEPEQAGKRQALSN